MKLTRIQAIKILENAQGNQDDPAWEYAAEEFYDEATDDLPTIMDVYSALGVTKAEYIEATGIDNVGAVVWPYDAPPGPSDPPDLRLANSKVG